MELSEINIEYRTNFSRNYMILYVDNMEMSYRTKMIGENTIPGLLRTSISYMNEGQQFMYEISSMQSLEIMFEKKKIVGEDVKAIVSSLMDTIEVMAEYFLNSGGLILAPSMIYMNPEKRSVFFVYNPFYNKDLEYQIEELSRYFLENVDYADSLSVQKVYELNAIIARKPFAISSLKELLITEVNDNKFIEEDKLTIQEKPAFTYNEEKRNFVHQKKFWDKIITGIKGHLKPSSKGYNVPVVCEEAPEYKVNPQPVIREILREPPCEIGDTVLLNEVFADGFILKPYKPMYNDISMKGNNMLIGKLENRVDVIINDPSISRIHAKCEKEGSRYFIEDLNTTNGTYLNDKRMIPYKLEEVADGDVLRMGQVEYRVIIK